MSAFVLDNARLWIGDGRERDGHVVVDDGVIRSVEDGRYAGDLPVTDLTGFALSPGLIDVMLSGAFGLSILRDDAVELQRKYLQMGITSCMFCPGNQPWETMHRLADNARRGTGFGLPIAKRIVTDHQGNIRIRSDDTGTVVSVTLPAA